MLDLPGACSQASQDRGWFSSIKGTGLRGAWLSTAPRPPPRLPPPGKEPGSGKRREGVPWARLRTLPQRAVATSPGDDASLLLSMALRGFPVNLNWAPWLPLARAKHPSACPAPGRRAPCPPRPTAWACFLLCKAGGWCPPGSPIPGDGGGSHLACFAWGMARTHRGTEETRVGAQENPVGTEGPHGHQSPHPAPCPTPKCKCRVQAMLRAAGSLGKQAGPLRPQGGGGAP